MTVSEHEEMVNAQNGQCAICNERTKLVIDHCHTTKKVRALLCDHCNKGLGFFSDKTELLKSAIAYLEKHSTAPVPQPASSLCSAP
jgi:hypothetical protein